MTEQNQRVIAIGAVGVAVLALALDNLVGLPVDEGPHFARFFGFSLVCVGAAAVLFLAFAPWAQAESGPETRLSWSAFGVGIASLAAVPLFPTGLPFVLAAGACVLGRLGDERAGHAAEDEDDRRRDETQEPDPGDEDESQPSRRASLAWASAALGVLVFAASLVLFAVQLAT